MPQIREQHLSPPTGGFLNINKPAGLTSAKVVATIKKSTKHKKVGHGGTLDPAATGVLPICLEQATRLSSYLLGGAKSYRLKLVLGSSTTTGDAEGEVDGEASWQHITVSQIKETVARFQGTYLQEPPMYSAIKRDGVPLYKLARRGMEVERTKRPVTLTNAKVSSVNLPEAEIELECGSGFYVRSYVVDLARKLNTLGYLKELCRLRVADFAIEQSVNLEEFVELAETGDWESKVLPCDYVLQELPRLEFGEEQSLRIVNGRAVPRLATSDPKLKDGQTVRAYGNEGVFLAIMRYDESANRFHPKTVLAR